MKSSPLWSLIVVVFLPGFVAPQPLAAQACKDEIAMVETYRKDLTDFVAKTKQESLDDFVKEFHRKSGLTKLTLAVPLAGETVDCLDKATHDSAATKEQTDEYKAEQDKYSKLRDKMEQDRKVLKATEDDKNAKALMAKFDFAP